MAIEKFVVSRDESIYEAWPDVVLTDSGKLISVFSECEHHFNRDNARIMITESFDRGRTWTKKRALTDKGVRTDFFNCARISKLKDKRLAIVCDKVTRDENSDSEIYVWLSDAEGTDWGEPTVYPFCGIVPDKLQQLESGRIILPAHFMNEATGKLEQYLWYSDDNMKTWSDRVTVAADERYNLCEVSVIECEPGV
ncbi:MAG: exo-alpha-sialidase, partial [Clostridia bacterium]|nr:exo-alpha-sialidase [Clostridia bacterium]